MGADHPLDAIFGREGEMNNVTHSDIQQFRIGIDKRATVILHTNADSKILMQDIDRLIEILQLVKTSFDQETRACAGSEPFKENQ